MLQRYRTRLSGPLLDRIDLHVTVPRVPHSDLVCTDESEKSADIRTRVDMARARQRLRLSPFGIHSNAGMQARHIRRFCPLDTEGDALLKQITDHLGLSARSFSRILKVARTIADLAASEQILISHLSEAVQYRSPDRAND